MTGDEGGTDFRAFVADDLAPTKSPPLMLADQNNLYEEANAGWREGHPSPPARPTTCIKARAMFKTHKTKQKIMYFNVATFSAKLPVGVWSEFGCCQKHWSAEFGLFRIFYWLWNKPPPKPANTPEVAAHPLKKRKQYGQVQS